ncbi:serine/threonine protein phosphatase PrpC [Stackebrandtia endophytica]|uniref:Serine/threonine protein phosphatase PrpC n=1 Tax=Stackebrandtia endophytica TaxID=1496996 RepID=A0A543APN2_9ACTN|nr:protein phosphatase 2C domain-containing protein [Stackebrandtia endophytica]TQL74537.1 serine/threonine protein phosphatase PrpC [Stackebrandtia endophytica]
MVAPWRPDTVGRDARAAEAPWRLHDDPAIPDSVLDGGRLGPVEVLAASVRGSSHRHYGSRREDAVAVAELDDRYIVAAVADGVGSTRDSHEASHRAVQHLIRVITTQVTSRDTPSLGGLRTAFDQVNAAIEKLDTGAATTLTAVVLDTVNPDGQGHTYHLAQLGDSPAAVLANGRFRRLFTDEPDGAVHSTTTHALPGSDLSALQLATGTLRVGESLFLASDGIANLWEADDVQEYLAPRWAEPPSGVNFLTQLQLRRKSFDDDRSVVAIWVPHRRTQRPPLIPGTEFNVDHYFRNGSCLSAGRIGDLEVRAASSRGTRSPAGARRDVARLAAFGDYVAGAVTRTTSTPEATAGAGDGHHFAVEFLRELATRPPEEPIEYRIASTLRETTQRMAKIFRNLHTVEMSALIVGPRPDSGELTYWALTCGEQPVHAAGHAIHGLDQMDTGAVDIDQLEGRWGTLADPVHLQRGPVRPGEALLATTGITGDGLGERIGGAAVSGAPLGPVEFYHQVAAGNDTESAAVAMWLDQEWGR